MLDIFSKIYEGLFPLNENIKKLKEETPENFIRHFSPHRFANCVALSDYTNPIIKAAITANKFHDHERAAVLLFTLVEHWLSTQPILPTLFIPIPLSPSRLQSRGYNQVKRILDNSNTGDIVVEDILLRQKDTKPQTSLNRIERFTNVENAFILKDRKLEPSLKRIVILDDVVTTGATMLVAESTLRIHLPKDCEIICIAIAH